MLYDKSRDNVIPSVLQLVTKLQLTSASSSLGIENRRVSHGFIFVEMAESLVPREYQRPSDPETSQGRSIVLGKSFGFRPTKA